MVHCGQTAEDEGSEHGGLVRLALRESRKNQEEKVMKNESR